MQALLDNKGIMNGYVPTYGMISADEYIITDAFYNSRTPALKAAYTWKKYSIDGENDWSKAYNAVYNTNLVLEQLQNIKRTTGNEQDFDNIKGSALFYRSFYFLQLLWNHAKAYDAATASKDLGIALRQTSDFNVPSVRTTAEAGYQQVISDTKSALQFLPVLSSVATRPSKCAAYGLLARCYLSMRDYANAFLYADSSLRLNDRLMDLNGDTDIPEGIAARLPFVTFNKETIFYANFNPIYYLFNTDATSRSYMDTTLISMYEDNDLRKVAFFDIWTPGRYFFKGSYSGQYYVPFAGITTSEMYLVRAEAAIRIDNMQAGLDDLNALLSKRYKDGTYMPYHPTDVEESLRIVLNERRKELVMRGLRWSDIKRLNKEGANIILKRVVNGEPFVLSPNANYYALPLPDDIIRLTGMPQNEE
ncbi:RagB/SusD family nutrient uptake outer membrane protein [Niabella terrae]